MIVLPPLLRTEVNFSLYKDDREEIIRMLANGEIKKEADRYGNEGFYWYYTPPEYIDAVKSEMIRAGMHSKDKFFVYFQSAEKPFMDMRGLQEGFIYSSTGEFPTAKSLIIIWITRKLIIIGISYQMILKDLRNHVCFCVNNEVKVKRNGLIFRRSWRKLTLS